MKNKFQTISSELIAWILLTTGAIVQAQTQLSNYTAIGSFSIPKSPSGLFFDEDGSSLLYVLCGTNTNGDHYLYAYNTDGEEQCLITIPQSVGMSRVDGFYITHDDEKAYIVDSQGPIYAEEGDEYLGGSLYEVEWTDPCGCSSGTCSSTSVEWSPSVTNSWSLSASDISDSEGGGVDEYFRNSGVVVVGDTWFGVNGVHPVDGTLTSEYSKSIIQYDMTTSSIVNTWSFDGDTVGRDVDMEGLTCGPDQCESYLYIGDEYNYIYKLDLLSGVVVSEWDLNSIVGNIPADKGIEALTYASTTGYFYAGIQETAEIHFVDLESSASTSTPAPTTDGFVTSSPSSDSSTNSVDTLSFTEITSFSIAKSPSGLFFDEDGSSLLYVLCGTNTNGDHYLYAYNTDGEEQCLITIPQSVGMSRVDGFYITHDDEKAYIVDSQGPIYAEEGDEYLGGSLYEVDWTDPCGCSSGTCSSTSVEWSPSVTNSWSLSASDISDSEGGGVDEYFRNSGVVVVGDTWFGVNGVHPVDGTLTSEYSKSIIQYDMTTSSIVNTWSFDGDTVGRDVDMEGLTCGPDQCESYLYIGDEYNYIYKLDLLSGVVVSEWDLNSIVGNIPDDKGIEALTYARATGYFYAGIQETAEIHVVNLEDSTTTDTAAPSSVEVVTSAPTSLTATAETTLSECTATDDYPTCSAPTIDLADKRVRREIRSLSTEEWDKVVAAMWTMKTTSMADGKALYGDSFRSYDYFVVKHVLATTDSRGDEAHFGAHFMTWHFALVLEFENSMLAIDPSIGAIPYWDECNTETSVFTDDYFGSDLTEAPYQVVDGKFANWPIETNFSLNDWYEYIVDNSTVLYFGGGPTLTILRSTTNGETNPYEVRYGSGVGWESAMTSSSLDDWWACTGDEMEEWNDWYACMEAENPSFHSGPHGTIGGRDQSTGGGEGEGPGGGGGGGGGPPARRLRSLQDVGETLTASGDFEDFATSPNAPIFMFHHANLDRSRLWWMRRHNSEAEVCKYYGFPLTDADYIQMSVIEGGAAFYGAHLNDVVSSTWGFTPSDLGIPYADSSTESGQVTHADLLCWFNPESVPYTYDTNVDCLNDSSLCHSAQSLDGSTTSPTESSTVAPSDSSTNSVDTLSFTEITSFSIAKSPSGLFFDEDGSSLLYVLCGTNTNGDHYLYAYNTDGEEQCLITIPQSVGMSRVDGFYITHDDEKAYIVDSQGPIYAEEGDEYLGGSLYEVDWTDPCGCSSGTCSSTSVEWSPSVTNSWSLSASDISDSEGGGVDEYFRNSGVVVVGDTWFGVNGVHPVDGTLTSEYSKSIIQYDMTTSSIVNTWSFDGDTVGRDVDMEGLTCGPDQCESYLYIGDEYNYIYKLDLLSGVVVSEWDLNSIVGNIPADKGIEALTYASTTGYFYAGIQETAEIHFVDLESSASTSTPAPTTDGFVTSSPSSDSSTNSVDTLSFTEITSFSIAKSPSGLFFDEDGSSLLYVLCGTNTNGDHYLYAYNTDGEEQCLITIPQSVGMSRVDGFYITHDDEKAYIVDSQGPIYAEEGDEYLGGSLYEVDWTDPCGCSSGTCSSTSVEWSPSVTNSWSLSASDISDSEGGGVDEYFRNSGVVVVGDTWFGVNGVHPVDGTLTSEYSKSIIQYDMTTSSIVNTWSFDGDTVGRDVDMEGLTCGPDQCESYLYIGDEYNYIYKLDLLSGVVVSEWDLNSIVGNIPDDKGIEALTYARATGYFYAGIQETAEIHVVNLEDSTTTDTAAPSSVEVVTSAPTSLTATAETTLSECTATDDYPTCSAPTIDLADKRVRREIRSLSTEEWDKVVAAMWTMKTTSMADGKALYGDSFRSYDYFVVKHVLATTDSRGDEAHFGAHFMTWHFALVLEFENSMLAIDPSIGAIPYWDECNTETSVFTDDYFGSDLTEAPYQVVDGKFANWPIETNFSLNDWYEYIVDNSTVLYFGGGPTLTILRSTTNGETNPYEVRYGSGVGWESAMTSSSLDDWWACTGDEMEEWNDWYACMEAENPSFHSGPHGTIGGRDQSTGGGEGEGPGGGGGGGGGPPARRLRSLQDVGETLTASGDFEDFATSPNAPIFMFHHANLDRSRLWWMRRHNSEAEVCKYYGFPLTDADYIQMSVIEGGAAFYGAHLNDVVSSTWGFTPSDLGIPYADSSTESGQVTHADLLCWFNPESVPYTYDTNVDCLNDSSLCHSAQSLDGSTTSPTESSTVAPSDSSTNSVDTLSFTEITSFSIAKSPSGLFFDEDGSSLLYVLCGTNTNGDHYLYAYNTDGEEQCLITIPQSVGMSRVDGFYITHDDEKAYIVDSQGPIYAEEGDEYLGGSLYEVDWTDPCGCSSGTCSSTSVEWSPSVTNSWSLSASDISDSEGGGVDEYFRNSGVVVVGDTWFGVNGVHPVDGTLTSEYSKSIIQYDMTTSSIVNTWSFDGDTVGRDVDMEGLTCGPDQCESYLYIGDEYNYIYKLDLLSGVVVSEWDLNSIVGNIPADKGIEALTYASTTGYFYAGIQETAEIHFVDLESSASTSTPAPTTDGFVTSSPSSDSSTNSVDTLSFTEITSFSIAKSPSGLFFDEDGSSLLYVLCGTNTNGDHYLYAYNTDGEEQCLITIPQSVGMSRVDGFYITHDDEKAYIVDSQGPIYAEEGDEYLGGSLYEVDWTDPCGCSSGTCSSTSVEWSPSVTNSWSLSASDISDSEGGGVDEYFRNSGVVVVGDTWFGVNGVHPVDGTLTSEYTKSIIQYDMTTSSIVNTWSFDGDTVGRDVDMEGLTCGPDQCESYLYIGDEYNYIYKLDLLSGVVVSEWDLNSIVGNIPADKGIEALTYARTTGYFYAGIQETGEIHVVNLEDSTTTDTAAPSSVEVVTSAPTSLTATAETTLSECTATDDYPTCSAPTIDLADKRVRREIRSLSTEEWDKVVAAMWTMKTTSMADGKALYGDSFRSYDYFVVKHVLATTDSRGDEAHFGAHFMTWHFALVLEFENSMLAIDPSIGAIPYWDECNTETSVFTDDYFGSDLTEAPYQVVDGKFANWPIETNFSLNDWYEYIVDNSTVMYYGGGPTLTILRAETNGETNPYEVRYGSGVSWESAMTSSSLDDWWACTGDEMEEWNDWYACMEAENPSFHSGPHGTIGGRDQSTGGGEGGGPGGGGGGGGGPPARRLRSLQDVGETLTASGDFEDFATSPNAPIFMFHHANLDRSRLWWMRRHNSEAEVCKYYGFPLTDADYIQMSVIEGGAAFYGAHLNDVVSSTWGFTPSDLGIPYADSSTESGQVTHADLLCWFNPESVPYTYDTNVDCLNDSSLCHSAQSLDGSTTSPTESSTVAPSDSSTNSVDTLSFTEITSFSIAKSPSGLFFDEDGSSLLYVLCGTNTNGDHYLYAYNTDGEEQCLITIPQSVGMSRVDGFYITHDDEKAYIVDSQGPIYAEEGDEYLGGSLYEVDWTDPCGCSSGTCSSTSVEWSPSVTNSWSLSASDISDSEGGGVDEYFRNSGVVVVGDTWFGVNGVHPVDGTLTSEYTKSIIQYDMTTSSIVNTWSFDGDTVGRDVDMEGLTCGPDQCESYLYIGDEYNYIYKLDLLSGVVVSEWDLNSIVGNIPADKGIEALTYASTTGYFYAGIQETAEIHVVDLESSASTSTPAPTTDGFVTSSPSSDSSTNSVDTLSFTEITSFSIAKSPSGLFFDEDGSSLLYVLCGTNTNGDHYLYAYNTDGEEQCLITIPQSVGMSRVDGFYITHDDEKAYIVDSQGPIYAEEGDEYLGGSLYEVDWTDPCGCSSGTCSSTSVEWSPSVTNSWSLSASDISDSEGGGVDEYFRNSGVVVVGDTWFGVNGVHPVDGTLTSEYTKSIIQYDMTTSSIVNTWSFDGDTVGRDVDMEGLTCGPDQCESYLYIGDEYNYIYKLDLLSGVVVSEWDLNSIVGNIPADKGIEALTYASTTGYFYAGIQETGEIHVVNLEDSTTTDTAAPSSVEVVTSAPTSLTATAETTLSECTATDDYPTCSAPTIDLADKRVRREIRSLSTEEWDKVVAAMWTMKTTSMADGKALYGDSFRSYDYFVVKHVLATTDSRGDEAHFGAHFMTWHFALVLEFENSMLAIDPSIGAIPYWDECNTETSVFTDDYFGSDLTEAPYQVVDGKFANWPIETNFSLNDWYEYIVDNSTVMYYGGGPTLTILRAETNGETNPYEVRYGSGVGWESAMTSSSLDDWWACTGDEMEEWNDWYACMEAENPSFHSGPHGTIGGRDQSTGGGEGEGPGGGGGGGGGPPARRLRSLQDVGETLTASGDFEDFATSPNAPIFMFHHANLDRSRLWWMRRHNSEAEVCKYYGFPLTDADYIQMSVIEGGAAFYGAHLNDVVSSTWGFTPSDLGIPYADSSTESGQVTHADLLCWFNPESVPYTYDTNVDCLNDSSLCHSAQSLDGSTTSPTESSTVAPSDSSTNSVDTLSFTEITSFSIAKSPSGLFFDEDGSSLLYVLCGTNTNGDHYLYAYNTDGEEQCLITIPQSVGMSRVDGFYITHDDEKAYIVDSQGPIYAEEGDEYLGGSLYEVEWTDPCGCSSGTCSSTSVEWSPSVTNSWSLSASDISDSEGGGVDEYFRNSGVVVVGDTWFGVNGVHPVDGTLTSEYTKSIIQYDMTTSSIVNTWSFDGDTVGRDVDMEGLTCGPDQCESYLYIGDEYNYIYKLDLLSGVVVSEWDLNSIVGNIPADKGIEALTYASTTGYFYAGIQETAEIHVVLLEDSAGSEAPTFSFVPTTSPISTFVPFPTVFPTPTSLPSTVSASSAPHFSLSYSSVPSLMPSGTPVTDFPTLSPVYFPSVAPTSGSSLSLQPTDCHDNASNDSDSSSSSSIDRKRSKQKRKRNKRSPPHRSGKRNSNSSRDDSSSRNESDSWSSNSEETATTSSSDESTTSWSSD